MQATTRTIGKLGEDIACKWLENHGFLVIERNYLKKWGELDIIAAKDKLIHFIEVKSVNKSVDKGQMSYRPEENVHELKVRRLRRIIATYLAERKYDEADFRFHVITVELDQEKHRAHVNFLENLIL